MAKKTKAWPGATLWKLDDITPYPHNPRTHPPAQVAFLAELLRKFGPDQPIVVDEDGVILKGHGRKLAAAEAEMKTFPVVQRLDMSDEDKRAMRIADNQSALMSGWDGELMKFEIESLKRSGYDVALLGFGEAQLVSFMTTPGPPGQFPAFGEDIEITASAKNATHHLVEEVRIVGGNYAAKGQRGMRVSADAPLPTVFAGVHGGGPHQFSIERAARVVPGDRGNRRRREEGKPHSLDEPLTAVMADGGRNTNRAQFMVEAEADISKQAIGREYDKLNPGEQSDKYFSLVRADAGQPSPTVTAAGGMNSGIACVVHPTEKRKFSIAELKRICAFPDDFALSGSYAQQWERLGRAVPPLMMRAIAESIRDSLVTRPRGRRASGASSGRRSAASSDRRAGSAGA